MALRSMRVGDVFEQVHRMTSVSATEIYPMVGARNFARGAFEANSMRGTDTKYRELQLVKAGDLIYPKLGAWEGAFAFVESDLGDRYTSPEYCVFTIRSTEVDAAYLRHLFAWEPFWRSLAARSTGTNVRRRRLQPTAFLDGQLPLPDLPEQQNIASRLDRLAERSDGLLRSTHTGSSILKLVPRFLDRVWTSAQLPNTTVGELCRPINDLVKPGQDPSPAKEFVGLEFIQGHTGLRLGGGPVTGLSGRKFRFQEGDVLYGYLRPYQNKVWEADRAGLCSVEQYVLRPNPQVDPTLLSLALRSSRVLDYAVSQTNSLQLPRLGSRALLAASVPDVRLASLSSESNLKSTVSNCVRAASLTDTRNVLRASLLPAARNEVFSQLI